MFEFLLPLLSIFWNTWVQTLEVPAQKNSAPAPIVRVIDVETTAAAHGMYDTATGEWHLAKNIDEVRPLASITKLVTALTILEYDPELEALVAFTEEDKIEGGRVYFGEGEELTLRQWLAASLVASDNSAIQVLVRSVETNRNVFVERMNEVAQRIGMNSARFAEPTGLDPANVASVRDIGMLYKEVLTHPEIISILKQSEITVHVANTGREQRLSATNWLTTSFLKDDPYEFLGGKTGYLDEAGYCLVSAAGTKEHPEPLIAVVLDSASRESRAQEVKSLLWAALEYDTLKHESK